jgi:bifunctional DNA-binding transcriptional regulator/antitoxin component of YhaV-PrlF toxin-antitoxin module
MRSSRLTVGREGVLTLPAEVCDAAGLRPGDILAIEVLGESFVLEVYRELLASGWEENMDAAAFRDFVTRFLSRPLTTLEPGGHVRIPEEVFPLPAGSVVSLFTEHSLQIFVE